MISNTGGGTLTWNVSADQPWIELSPTSGTNSETVTINISTTGLSSGNYSGTITVTSNDGTKTGTINLNVRQPPLLSVSPDPPSFNFQETTVEKVGTTPATPQTFSISNTGGETLIWSVSADQPWITLSQTSGTNSGTVTIGVNTAGLSPGSYSGTITVTSNGGSKTGTINLNIKFIIG
jgi:hypothetical protein